MKILQIFKASINKLYSLRFLKNLPLYVSLKLQQRHYKNNSDTDAHAIIFNYGTGTYCDFFYPIYARLKKYNYNVKLRINCLHPDFYIDSRFQQQDYLLNSQLNRYNNILFIHATTIPSRWKNKKNFQHIQLNHGFGSFRAALNPSYLDAHSYLIANTHFQKYQVTNYPELRSILSKESVLELGYPKIDDYIQKTPVPLKRVNAIFYGPTYHQSFSSIFRYLDTIIDYCRTHQITLYIKLHPFLLQSFSRKKSGGINWEKKIKQLAIKNPCIVLLPTKLEYCEVVEYFKKSDVFVTDNSGLGIEFSLITQKPCVFLDNKIKAPPTGDFSQFPETTVRGYIGPIVETPETFGQYLSDISMLNSYQSNLAQFNKDFTFNLGHASDSIINQIEKILST